MKTRIRIVCCVGLCLCGLLSVASSCTITVTGPATATRTNTETAAMPAGASLVVSNELGTTRVTVDPTATQATVQITRVAYAQSQEDADALLDEMVVTVTPPTAEDNRLVVTATVPPAATEDQSDFNMSISGEDVVISAVFGEALVAKYRLDITLPPGHAVDATQTAGLLRTNDLDTASTLSSDDATIRCTSSNADVAIQSKAGSVVVSEHAGSLSVDNDSGALTIDIQSLAADESITAHVDSGSISIDLPAGIDAELEAAITTLGGINFDEADFGEVIIDVQTPTYIRVQLNEGGPAIDLSTSLGNISVN